MKSSDNRLPIVKAVSVWTLIFPIFLIAYCLYDGFDWIAFIISSLICYPLWCFGVQSVKFYEDCIIVFRPFIFSKKTITYDQIDHIKDVLHGRTTPVFVPYDVYIYINGKKQPTGIPMPWSSQNKEILKNLIETKGIKAEWGIYR